MWLSSGLCSLVDPAELGNVKDVAAVEALLTGERLSNRADGGEDEGMLGVEMPFSVPRLKPELVLMRGTEGRGRNLVLWRTVSVPFVRLISSL